MVLTNEYLVPVLGAILVAIISIIAEWLLIKIKIIDLEKIKKNKKEIEKINKELKELYDKFKEGKVNPQELSEKQKKMLSLNFEIMKEKFKISLAVMIPIFFIFGIIYRIEGGFGWWFVIYFIAYLIIDKILRIVAKKMKVEIDA
jgi:uncharacterized membrane protein (DUF106 family)